MSKNLIYAEVLFNHPVDKAFIYHAKDNEKNLPLIGKRVIADFNNNLMMGFIINIHHEKPDFKTKPINEILDSMPVFTVKQIKLAAWISRFYHCSNGEALSIMVPKEKNPKKVSVIAKFEPEPLLNLNDEQEYAYQKIKECIDNNKSDTFLLHGITGSGKTEIYKHIARINARSGKQTLILVPEIALTPQTMSRFLKNFGSCIAILHSRINAREKLWYHQEIISGRLDIIMGARSAIFAPFKNLGAIIIDEEHETSYKSSDTPRYHARQIAYYLSKEENIPLVLGSATPSLETFFRASNDEIPYLILNKRHSLYPAPSIELVDMRDEWAKGDRKFTVGLISEKLSFKILDRLEKKEQVIIFLNRRGYATGVVCLDCGEVLLCPNCGIALTYHSKGNMLKCHYCNYEAIPPKKCPACKSIKLNYKGFGTQRIYSNLQSLFPDARIERMDFDSVRAKDSYDIIFARLKENDIDILVGTQMIAKGMHFPNITLCGVLMADSSLSLPDFRASERTFSLITQVSGRVGRGDKKGEVIIQAFDPGHYSITSAINQDYKGFADRELKERQKYMLPPFTRLAKLLVRGEDEEYVKERIMTISKKFSVHSVPKLDILGPSPCPITKINKNYRWHLIIRSDSHNKTYKLVETAKELLKNDSKVYLEIDIDPVTLM